MNREQKLEKALKMARSWMHCVEPRLLDTPNFRRDLEAIEAALSAPKAEAAEPVAYLVHNFMVARQPVSALAKFPEPDHYLYPANRKYDAEATAKMLRADCDPLYTSPVPALTDEDETERRLDRVVAPDNGTVPEVLAAILKSAHAWVPEARIIGNVRAGDIARAVEAALAAFPVSAIPDKAVDRAVELTYRNWRGKVSTRRLSPERIWYGSTEWHPEPQWLLRAYDHEKQAHRDFALKDFGVPALTDEAVERATHRHKKRGTDYVLLGIGKMQAESWFDAPLTLTGNASVDMREVAIYRGVEDGSLWVRPRNEFEDGRFEALAAFPSKREGE